nr:hypothetical protein [Tanacetum cinerariifolium]
MHDPVEWRLYDSCDVHHVLSRDQEIFMLVERDYPLRKGLAIMMIRNKLQVENYSQIASDLIQKIHKIENSPRRRSIPTASDEFPLPGDFPTASEERQLCKSSQVPVSTKKAPLKEATKRVVYVSTEEPCWVEDQALQGMSLEEIREKFIPVWKQIKDFVPMGSKEEGERFKRKGLRLEQDSAKKVKTLEEVSEEDLKTMMQLVSVEELWALVKETLNIRKATSDKEKELWVELKRLYEPDVED